MNGSCWQKQKQEQPSSTSRPQAQAGIKPLEAPRPEAAQAEPPVNRECVRDKACTLPEAAQAEPLVNPPLLYIAQLTATTVLACLLTRANVLEKYGKYQ